MREKKRGEKRRMEKGNKKKEQVKIGNTGNKRTKSKKGKIFLLQIEFIKERFLKNKENTLSTKKK